MKKLMFAMAAVAAGAAFADGIVSDNVVGYQSVNLVEGYNLYSPTFEGVGKSLNIQDLKLSGVEGFGEDIIYIIGDDGNSTGDTYTWITKENSGADEDGWYDADGWATDDITEGQGFYLCVGVAGTMTCSGQVKFGQYSRNLVTGYNMVGNCSPVEISYQGLKLVGAEGFGEDIIYVIGDDGNSTGYTYTWITKENSGADEDGWYDPNGWTEDMLPAGQGLYMCVGTDCKMTLPEVLPAK